MEQILLLKEKDSPLISEGFLIRHYPSYRNRIPSLHSVDVFLFSWFVKGSGIHYIGENQFSVKSGSLGITPPGIGHQVTTSLEMEIYNLFIHLPRFPLPHLPVPFMGYLHHLLPLHHSLAGQRENGLQINSSRPEKITGILEQLRTEQAGQGFGRSPLCYELLRLLFMELIRDIAEKGHRPISRVNFRQEQRIMKIVSFLDLHFSDQHSLNNLARSFGFSKSALCSHFKKAMGRTVFEYILMKRIERCSLLLSSTVLDISRIAYDCGFNDISYFNRKFKDFTGLTPRAFRMKNGRSH